MLTMTMAMYEWLMNPFLKLATGREAGGCRVDGGRRGLRSLSGRSLHATRMVGGHSTPLLCIKLLCIFLHVGFYSVQPLIPMRLPVHLFEAIVAPCTCRSRRSRR